MYHSHRTWFPYILIGLTIALLLIVVAILGRGPHEEIIPALQEHEYIEVVGTILDTYKADSDAHKAYESLLALKIEEGQREVHLDLVLMFGKLLNGELDSIDEYIVQLDEKYTWLIE